MQSVVNGEQFQRSQPMAVYNMILFMLCVSLSVRLGCGLRIVVAMCSVKLE
jgi:hypothetical protein